MKKFENKKTKTGYYECFHLLGESRYVKRSELQLQERVKECEKNQKTFPLLIKERKASASLQAERLQGEVIAFEEEKKITSPHPQPFSLMRRRGQKVAFTLAETLITLTILGVIAAITVPSLINKQIESANRTKLKKAMTVYEKALNQMIIDNDLKTNGAIKTEFPANDCSVTSTYFKPVETTDSACRFKTADRVWWDISDIEAPIISLKDEIKTDANATTVKGNAEKLTSDHTSFIMIGYLDDTTGVLRINDLGVAKDGETVPTAKNKTYISKLYNFINNQKESSSGGTGSGTTEKCTLKEGSTTDYICTGSTLKWKKQTIGASEISDRYFCIWDGETCTEYEDDISKVSAGDIFVSESFTISSSEALSACSDSRYEDCEDIGGDYWNAARKKCEQNGSHLATAAELKALYTAGKLDDYSNYWAAEAYSRSTNFSYCLDTDIVNVDIHGVDDYLFKAVCVGN